MMKTLKTILESWNADHSSHKSAVDGHNVEVGGTKFPDRHSIWFKVNGQAYQKATMPLSHKMAILSHVRKKIGEYIDHHKPNNITMAVVRDESAPLYKAQAADLARKHGYDTHQDQFNTTWLTRK